MTFGFITLQSASSGFTFLMLLPLLTSLEETDGFSVAASRFSFIFNFFPKTLGSILVVFSLLMCFTALVAYQGQRFSVMLQQKYNQFLRNRIYRAVLGANWSFLSAQKKSDLIYTLMIETQNVAFCHHQLLTLMTQALMMTAYALIAFYLSWSMTLIAFGTALFLLVLMFPQHRKMSSVGDLNLKANQKLQQILTEHLSAMKWIKGTGIEHYSMTQFEKTSTLLQEQYTNFQLGLGKNKGLYTVCSAFVFCGLLFVGIEYLAIPLAQFFVLLVIYARILPMVSSSQQVYQTLLHKFSSYKHIEQLLKKMDMEQENLDDVGTIAFNHEITLNSVSFRYPNSERWLFNNFNLQIRKNRTIVLVGPSGVGKTTLVDLVVGLVEPQIGMIKVDYQILSSSNKIAWRRSIAYMTQDIFLFNSSIRDNLLGLATHFSEEEMNEALRLASADFVFDLPQGLDTIIGDNGTLLSGGERQRIGLARAILQKPALLILDESTNALDEDCVSHIYSSLSRLKGKMTILIISHDKIPSLAIDDIIELVDQDLQKISTSSLDYEEKAHIERIKKDVCMQNY